MIVRVRFHVFSLLPSLRPYANSRRALCPTHKARVLGDAKHPGPDLLRFSTFIGGAKILLKPAVLFSATGIVGAVAVAIDGGSLQALRRA
jgi:hypothetical protein